MRFKSLTRVFKSFDLFGETASFTFERGSQKYNSVIGATISLLVFSSVALQAAEKYEVLISRGDTNHQAH